jgi:hypothetical protein
VNDQHRIAPNHLLLVLPDRDTATEVADEVARRWPNLGPTELVRDSLAGEDDAEGAQWLVVLDPPADTWDSELRSALYLLADEHDGWSEDA